MRAASAASRIRRRELAAPRSTSLSPTITPAVAARSSHPCRSRSTAAAPAVGSGAIARTQSWRESKNARGYSLRNRVSNCEATSGQAGRSSSGDGARTTCRNTCGRLRSQRASAALASAASTEPAASASNMSLTMFSAVSRSISSAFFRPTAV